MIFFDLDGPILDVSEKYYQVYSDILIEYGYTPISKKRYWNAKRSKTPNADIFKMNQTDIDENIFLVEWKKRIEAPYYLNYDKIQDGAVDLLEKWSARSKIVLVTLRSSRQVLHKQLIDLGLISFFLNILSSGENCFLRWTIKYDLIKKYLGPDNNTRHIMIGDTETDILAGNNLNFITVAISNGIRCRSILSNCGPTYLFETISDFYTSSIHFNII